MRTLVAIVLLFFSTQNVFSGEKPRTPFVVLKINGKIYKNADEIPVRAGARIKVEAILMGGRRDYCSNPDKYANKGKNTRILEKGEDGMSFSINGGQFVGTWSLTQETATFSSIDAVKIIPVEAGNKTRIAYVEIPQSDYSKIYLKVQSRTEWHYIRRTPAGESEKDEENSANATFNLVIGEGEEFIGSSNEDNESSDDAMNVEDFKKMIDEDKDTVEFDDNLPMWYSSRNIIAHGMEDFTVRNELNEVQKFYNLIEKHLMANEIKRAEQQIKNLETYVGEVHRAISDAKAKNPEYKCQVTFVGLPTEIPMGKLKQTESLADLWKERFYICQSNVSRINDILLNYQTSFSANILKSVVKNYINWGSGLPTGYQDLLTQYDPSNVLGITNLPNTFMGWYQEAESDANILKNQAQTIKKLSELREFYLERMSNYVNERKKLQEIFDELSVIKEKNDELEHFFSNLGWAKFNPKN